ncbi:hypothetical protein P9112_009607 [Eukaryota sp. TZLM1-RC]
MNWFSGNIGNFFEKPCPGILRVLGIAHFDDKIDTIMEHTNSSLPGPSPFSREVLHLAKHPCSAKMLQKNLVARAENLVACVCLKDNQHVKMLGLINNYIMISMEYVHLLKPLRQIQNWKHLVVPRTNSTILVVKQ